MKDAEIIPDIITNGTCLSQNAKFCSDLFSADCLLPQGLLISFCWQPPDQGCEPAAALGPPSRDPGDAPATCSCLLHRILLTKLFSKMPMHPTSEADTVMRWHMRGEARQNTENQAVQGADNPPKGLDSHGVPMQGACKQPWSSRTVGSSSPCSWERQISQDH